MSSSTTSAPTSTSTSTSSTDHRPLITAVILSVFAVLVIGGILWFTLRSKRTRAGNFEEGRAKGDDVESSMWWGVGVDKNHPAARITPFSRARVRAGGPQFGHTPGSNMRIAIRRPDGAWSFSDPRAPFTPSIISDIDALSPSRSYSPSPEIYNSPSPSASVAFLPQEPPKSAAALAKEQESKAAREIRLGYDRFDLQYEDPGDGFIPPPAYGYGVGYGQIKRDSGTSSRI